ncbi:hypothetical protein D9M68_582850 [compost metagenome]
MHGTTRKAFRFIPTGSGCEAKQGNRIGMVVRAGLALLKEPGDLIQRQERQFDLVSLYLPDVRQRVCLVPGTKTAQLGEDRGQVTLFMVDRLRLHLFETMLPISRPCQ